MVVAGVRAPSPLAVAVREDRTFLKTPSQAGEVSAVCTGLSAAGSAPSPRVPVAIRNIAVSRIAAVSAAVTSALGVFIDIPSRCSPPRVVAKIANDPGK